MLFKSDIEIERIAKGLLDCSLPRSEWTHAAHFAAATWLMASDDHDAFIEMPGLIRCYNESTGTPNTESEGYHETITIASLRAIRDRLEQRLEGQPLHEVVNQIVQSELGDTDWLLKYWSKECLFKKEARARWIEPDLAPLPYS